jgi:hypothetical protein
MALPPSPLHPAQRNNIHFSIPYIPEEGSAKHAPQNRRIMYACALIKLDLREPRSLAFFWHILRNDFL